MPPRAQTENGIAAATVEYLLEGKNGTRDLETHLSLVFVATHQVMPCLLFSYSRKPRSRKQIG